MDDAAGALQAANALHRAGRLAEAEAAYRAVLAAEPANALACANLGNVLLALRRAEGAIDAYERARVLVPQNADLLGNLGMAYALAGRYEQAIEALEEARALAPELAELQNNLSTVYRTAGNYEAAAGAARGALALRAGYAEAHGNLALALHALRRYDEAISQYREAIRHRPGVASTHSNLAAALESLGRYDEALHECRAALAIDPNYPHALSNLGAIEGALHHMDAAFEAFRAALRVAPEFAEAHRNFAMNALLAGDFHTGWEHYAWRTRVANRRHEFARLDAIAPWNGASFAGRRLLVATEQGLGDFILMARYFPLVKSRGGEVIVECPDELRALFEKFPGIDAMIGPSSTVHEGEFDFCTTVVSLPQFFTPDLASIPASKAYLRADPARVPQWRARVDAYAGALNVGIVWGGGTWNLNDRYRSCHAGDFEALAAVEGVQLFSLQKGPRETEAGRAPASMRLVHLGDGLADFADTAAALEALDLTIAVDTSIVHLAGALGKPVWNVLAFNAYWVWLLDRADSPWYPSVRLFRQPAPGDWSGVFLQVAAALQELRSGAAPQE